MQNQDDICAASQKLVFVDSHCHLCFKKFVDIDGNNHTEFSEKYSIDSVIERADAANVKYMLAIATELTDIDEIGKITEKYKNVFRTIGIHPLEASKHCKKYSMTDIAAIITDNCNSAIGIGEIGLDYYYSIDSINEQHELLELQLDLAEKYDLPVCIHSRNAEDDTISILKNHPKSRGIIHCFTGSREFAYRALDLGFYISASGIITFKKSETLHDTFKNIPLEKLLIETDAPFLAPMPFRGKTNEPAFVVHTAQKLAEILEVSLSEVATKTTANFVRIFGISNSA